MPIIKYFITAFFTVTTCFANSIFENPTFIKLEEELGKVKTAQGNIIQHIKGDVTTANFLLAIPGRLRINYPKHKLTLIINNGVLIYYDGNLDQKSETVNFNNPFLKSLSQLSLKGKHYKVIDFVETEKEVIVIVKFTVETREETHKIIFTKNGESFNLTRIEDLTLGSNIYLTFSNIKVNGILPPKSFTIENNKIDKKFNF